MSSSEWAGAVAAKSVLWAFGAGIGAGTMWLWCSDAPRFAYALAALISANGISCMPDLTAPSQPRGVR